MKRLKGSFVVSLILISVLLGDLQTVFATEKISEIDLAKAMGEDLEASYQPQGGSIVIDAATGQVLYARDADKVWHVASLTKIMTLYLAYEALESGEISEKETFKVTQKYVDISQIYALSNNKMKLGAEYTFDDLVKLMMIVSSNAATMLMADTIAGDEGAFVDLMNAKAKELGMTQTRFYNASGSSNELLGDYAPKNQPKDGDNQGTARDFALLSYRLLKDYPQAINHTNQYRLTIKKESDHEESFTAHHLSLEGGPTAYKGTDGLKTGSSDSAGYNLVSTAKQNGMRLISVVLGVGDWPDDDAEKARNIISNALHDAQFKQYSYERVLARGVHTINEETIVLEEDLYAVVEKETAPTFVLEDHYLSIEGDFSFVSEAIKRPVASYRTYQTPKPQKGSFLKQTWHGIAYQWWLLGLGSLLMLIVGLWLILSSKSVKKGKHGRVK
ncbi:DUF1958 domain-containing protein [Streptococcus rifensis]